MDIPPPDMKMGQLAKKRGWKEKWMDSDYLHVRQLSPSPEKCQLSSHYLAPTSVGRKILDGGGRGTPGCRQE
jgi:hypothetical protein